MKDGEARDGTSRASPVVVALWANAVAYSVSGTSPLPPLGGLLPPELLPFPLSFPLMPSSGPGVGSGVGVGVSSPGIASSVATKRTFYACLSWANCLLNFTPIVAPSVHVSMSGVSISSVALVAPAYLVGLACTSASLIEPLTLG